MVLDVSILLDIAAILLVAKVLGELAERLGFSSLIGEVIAGVILGPVLMIVKPSAFLEQIAGFGILFLLFLIGLNTRFEDIKKDSYRGSVLAIAGAALSFVGGFLVGEFVFNSTSTGIFLGVAIMSTSTAITLRSLIDVGEMKTRVYEITLAISMADDVIAILALSLLTTFFTYGAVQLWTVVALFFAVLGFFLVIMTVGSRFIGKFIELFKVMRDEQILISIALVIVFAVAFLSEQVGIASVTGAFLAGVALNRSRLSEEIIVPKMKVIGFGFFVPLFFAYSAIVFDLHTLLTAWPVVLLLLAVGVAAKFVGCGYLSKIFKLGKKEQRLLGFGMMPRGEYSIVIAQLALGMAIITNQTYTIVVSFVVLSILLAPVLLKIVAKQKGF